MEAFLKRVLPETGDYVVMMVDPTVPKGSQPPRHVKGIKNIDALVRVLRRLALSPLDLYFAVGSYDHERLASKARMKRAVFFDLDAKDFGGSKETAARELGVFLKTTGFPSPSIVVDSGGGLHCYWVFDRDIPAAEWKPLAEKLKAKALEHNFAIDPTVPADAARVLRVPETMNHKYSPPHAVRMLKDTGRSYDPASLLSLLAPQMAAGSAASILAGSVGDDLAGTGSTFAQIPYYTAEIAVRCGVMKEAFDTGGAGYSEPLWSNLLSVVAFTEDAIVAAPAISQGHAGYSESATMAKLDLKLKYKADNKLKPVLCTTFAGYKGSICSLCPYNGKIKTPLVLGKQEAISFLPSIYTMKETGIYKVKKSPIPDEPDVTTLAFPYFVSDVDMLLTGVGPLVKMTFTSHHNVIRVELPVVLFGDQSAELNKSLLSAGVIVGTFAVNELKHIMTHWLKKMLDIKQATKSQTTNLGWGIRGGEQVFVAGPKVYHAGGRVDQFTHPEIQLLRDYEVTGRREVWDEAAAMVLADGRQAIMATLLTAFSAPLMKFTGAAGLTFSLCSPSSGTGKSTVLKLAQAVWAHPTRAMAMLDDTPNSVSKKLGFINNLPAYWDEIRSTEGLQNFVKMIFQLGQGKEKARLTSSVKQQEMGTWETMIVMASNERIVDHVDHIVRNSNAGRLRVFEVMLPHLPLDATDPGIGRTVEKLSKNYGAVGAQYAQFLATNAAAVEKLVHTLQDKVATELHTSPDERFWVAFVAAELAAAAICHKLGYFNIDYTKLKKWLSAELVAQRAGIAHNYQGPEQAAINAIMQWAEYHRDQIVVSEFAGGKNGYGAVLVQPIMKEIVGLKATKDQVLRIKEAHFKTWVHSTLHHSPTALITELTKMGVISFKKSSVTAGIANTTSARFSCLEIDLSSHVFDGLIEET